MAAERDRDESKVAGSLGSGRPFSHVLFPMSSVTDGWPLLLQQSEGKRKGRWPAETKKKREREREEEMIYVSCDM